MNKQDYTNYGLLNEYDIVGCLSKKRFINLNHHWKKIIKQMFPDIDDSDIIYCEKIKRTLKEDIMIVAHGEKRTLSVKCGKNVSIHCERIDSFCDYLSHLGIDKKYINTLLLYHYGDETLDGTGTNRMGAEVLRKKYINEIKEFNDVVNKSEILLKILDRFLSYGTINQKGFVDYLYFGNAKKGEIYDIHQLIKFFAYRSDIKMSSIHFGPFVYCPLYRALTDIDIKHEDRHYTCIKWFGHKIDLDKYSEFCYRNNMKV